MKQNIFISIALFISASINSISGEIVKEEDLVEIQEKQADSEFEKKLSKSKLWIKETVPDPTFRRILAGSIEYRAPLNNNVFKLITHINCIWDYNTKVSIDRFYPGWNGLEPERVMGHGVYNRVDYKTLSIDCANQKELDLTGLEHLNKLKLLSLAYFERYKCPKLKPTSLPKLNRLIITDCKILPLNLQQVQVKEFQTNVELNDVNIAWLNGHKYIEDFTLLLKQQTRLPQKLLMPSVKKLTLKAYLSAFILQDLLIDINRSFPNLEVLNINDSHKVYMPYRLMNLISHTMPNIEELYFSEGSEASPFIRNSIDYYSRSRPRETSTYISKKTSRAKEQYFGLSFKDIPLSLPKEEEGTMFTVMEKLRVFSIRIPRTMNFIFKNKLNHLRKVQVDSLPQQLDSFKQNCPQLHHFIYFQSGKSPTKIRK